MTRATIQYNISILNNNARPRTLKIKIKIIKYHCSTNKKKKPCDFGNAKTTRTACSVTRHVSTLLRNAENMEEKIANLSIETTNHIIIVVETHE